jgi:hypothetical protein
VPRRYSSLDYEEGPYRPADLQRLDILVNGEVVDALARMVHRWAAAATRWWFMRARQSSFLRRTPALFGSYQLFWAPTFLFHPPGWLGHRPSNKHSS